MSLILIESKIDVAKIKVDERWDKTLDLRFKPKHLLNT
jgi:hypothetical protein